MKPLWSHQKETKALIKRQPRVFDMSDPGTGKTRAHLEAFAERRNKKGGKALITCPKTLMRSAWIHDLNEFVPGLNAIVAPALDRARMLDLAKADHVDVLITNTDAVKTLVKLPRSYWSGFDTWINDEHSSYKHRTSQRSRAALSLRQNFQYRAGLTGTPNPNSVTELWHQALLLDDGKRLGTNFWKFQTSCCEPVQIGPRREHIRWQDKEGIEVLVAELLRDITVRHEFDTCMDIPENVVRTVDYEPSKKLLKVYEEMERDALLELEEGDVTAVHAAVLRQKLLQIASGAVYGESRLTHVLDTERNELIGELVEEIDHSIVFFNWTHQRDGLVNELDKRKISCDVLDGETPDRSRERMVNEFQDGKIRCLLLHPKTGAHGLTLTRARRAIIASPFDEADLFKQARHRIWRGGQKHKTEMLLVRATDTIEGIVYERQQAKGARMDSLLDIIRESKR